MVNRARIFTAIFFFLLAMLPAFSVEAAYRFASFKAHPPIHIYRKNAISPGGFSPERIKSLYHLPSAGGHGTIAIIGAYEDPTIEKDLGIFSSQFKIARCTVGNGCFEKHLMVKGTKSNSGWALETSLDVEWAHAIAPDAHILLVEAKTQSGANLMRAVDYAASRADVVAISMSWGGPEFIDETKLDSHFFSRYGAVFFASSGDNGAGASWPAAAPGVVAVGGTSFASGSEKAWTGSGGGVSAYEPEPVYQQGYAIANAHRHRAIPDVAYNADPVSGFPIYKSPAGTSKKGWFVVGGTSAGAPQWAAIQALGHSASNANFYADKAAENHASFFHDIVSGKNGNCAYYCQARARYDYVTGLGSPLTIHF